MAPSTEYHKRLHSLSEGLRFSHTLKNASSVYYRRYSIRTTAILGYLKMTREVFVRGSSVSCLVIFNQSGNKYKIYYICILAFPVDIRWAGFACPWMEAGFAGKANTPATPTCQQEPASQTTPSQTLANEAADGTTWSVSAGVHYYDNYAFLRKSEACILLVVAIFMENIG